MLRILSTFFLAIALSFASLSSSSLVAQAEEGPSPEDVAFVQGLLIRFGYNPGPIDGICGDKTTIAVRAFHADRNLPLDPGEIEPQAATVVANLTSHLTSHVLNPPAKPPAVYEKALLGDPQAAWKIGNMYRDGDSVAADDMMAYAWWSVAESYGSSEAGVLKTDLETNGSITPHEVSFATALAEKIHESVALRNGTAQPAPIEDREDVRGRDATM